MSTRIHIHLVSDATGETNHQVVRACMVQFQGVQATEHVWSLVRTGEHVDRILTAIESYPGPVLYTIIDKTLCRRLEDGCQRLQVPCVPVLAQVLHTLGEYLGVESEGRPGRQHRLDAAYFERIEAMDYTLTHDDGQLLNSLDAADIILLGVSRTSKTPTALYLANRGYKVANVPLVSGMPVPPQIRAVRGRLIVGLTNDPVRLTQLRRNRMLMLRQEQGSDYVDLETVRQEVTAARRLFHAEGWPVIDVTRRSIEETAAGILQHYARFHGTRGIGVTTLTRGTADLVLASASPTRARLLRDAGLVFRIIPAQVDEPALRAGLEQEGTATPDAARALAAAKAVQVSRAHPGAVVLGADQLLEHRGRWLGKPETPAALRSQLAALAGTSHTLTSAVAACRGGAVLWQAVDTARLAMRPLGERFLERYLAADAHDLAGSVGGYRLEGTGSHLFSAVEGDWFTIMGLPLLPLLAWLRRQRMIED